MGGFSVATDTAIIVEEFETKFNGQEFDDAPNLDILRRRGVAGKPLFRLPCLA